MATTKKRAKTRVARKTATKAVAKKSPARKASTKAAATRRAATKRVVKKAASRTRAKPRAAAAKPKVAQKPARKRTATPRASDTSRSASAIDASVFPCGDAALRAATGKDWNEWLGVLDAAGAASRGLDHQQIWNLAMQSLPGAAGWWGQMVSVGYERARGLREKHETSAGDFQASLSKTLPVPLFAAFAAWADESIRGDWLDAPGLDFTKLNAGKNIRARWPGGPMLDIRFNATGPDKCQVVIDTMKLADAKAVKEAKAFWQAQLERLQAYFRV